MIPFSSESVTVLDIYNLTNMQHILAIRNQIQKFISVQLFTKFYWRHDIQQNDTQDNDTEHNDTQYEDTQHNDSQHEDTQHNGLTCDIQLNNTMLLGLLC